MARPLALRKVRRFRPFYARQVLEFLMDGESVKAIGSMRGMPNEKTIWLWATLPIEKGDDYEAEKREFQRVFDRLKNMAVEQCLHEALPIADTEFQGSPLLDKEGRPVLNAEGQPVLVMDPKMCLAEVARNKLRVETRLKLPALVKPEKYGPRVEPKQVDASITFQTINYFQAAPKDIPAIEAPPA